MVSVISELTEIFGKQHILELQLIDILNSVDVDKLEQNDIMVLGTIIQGLKWKYERNTSIMTALVCLENAMAIKAECN